MHVEGWGIGIYWNSSRLSISPLAYFLLLFVSLSSALLYLFFAMILALVIYFRTSLYPSL